MSSNSRQAFEEATGYNEVPKSAQDLLDLNSWPMWNIAWSKAVPTVGPEMRTAIENFAHTVDFESKNMDPEQTPGVLQKALTILRKKLDELGSQP